MSFMQCQDRAGAQMCGGSRWRTCLAWLPRPIPRRRLQHTPWDPAQDLCRPHLQVTISQHGSRSIQATAILLYYHHPNQVTYCDDPRIYDCTAVRTRPVPMPRMHGPACDPVFASALVFACGSGHTSPTTAMLMLKVLGYGRISRPN
jgi:hypothetical protein